jgi:hypothetical protein
MPYVDIITYHKKGMTFIIQLFTQSILYLLKQVNVTNNYDYIYISIINCNYIVSAAKGRCGPAIVLRKFSIII